VAEGQRPMPRPADQAVTSPVPRPDPPPTATDLPGTMQETQPSGTPLAGGPLCGSTALLGERLPPIDDAGACGIERPVLLSRVAGVLLEPQPTLSCHLARALQDWLEIVAKPAFEADGSALVGFQIAAGYVCRNVNYAEEGEVSEHAAVGPSTSRASNAPTGRM
jgi:hypothetical protein